jgi:CRISPR-associated protein Cas1
MGRIIEIANNHRHLRAERGFLVIEDSVDKSVIGRVPIDEITAVMAHGYQISYSNEVLVRLAERSVPLVLSNDRHVPVGVLLSIAGNGEQAKRFDAQIAASLPTRKRLWAEIVRAKVRQQAMLLDFLDKPSKRLWDLALKVKSGDPTNIEAQAAKMYWSRLFDKEFRRDRSLPGANAQLNYGYTVLRAATARSVSAAGLHPTLGVHHSNQGNPLRLVDDLMEPFRPFIDHQVAVSAFPAAQELTPEVKLLLVETLSYDLSTKAGLSPISSCLSTLAVSLTNVYQGDRENLDLPVPQIAMDMQDVSVPL